MVSLTFCIIISSNWCLAAMALPSSSNVTMNENEQSVLTSVIRVLEHLMIHHKKLICMKMLNIFKVNNVIVTTRLWINH